MGRGRRLKTLDDFKRALKGKYGLGEREHYKPWLRVQDVKSIGVRSQIWGRKTHREHHTLSSIETEFFYLSEFCDSVIDIREQFPLFPLNVTQKIATSIGVKHPTIPGTDTPNIITTDLLLTLLVDGKVTYKAISCKPASEIKNHRVTEKIDIERIFWELLGVEFQVFTGNKLTKIQSKNISWATSPFRSCPSFFTAEQIESALYSLQKGKFITSDICTTFCEIIGVEHDDALNLLRLLIADKMIIVDISFSIEEERFLEVIAVNLDQRLTSNGYN
jgi:hypothetical protein